MERLAGQNAIANNECPRTARRARWLWDFPDGVFRDQNPIAVGIRSVASSNRHMNIHDEASVQRTRYSSHKALLTFITRHHALFISPITKTSSIPGIVPT